MNNPEQTVLLTGAAGGVGTLMRKALKKDGRRIRLFDLVEPKGLIGEDEEFVKGDVTNKGDLAQVCAGVDAIIHLGGLSRENSWDSVLDVNIDGTQKVLQAAVDASVRSIVLASSNQAVGFRKLSEAEGCPQGRLPADATPPPDTFYGVSKAAMEALGSLYSSRFGLDVTVIRIGSCCSSPVPMGRRGLMTWLSPVDFAGQIEAAIAPREPGYRIIWGMSANSEGVYSLEESAELGYRPASDASAFRDDYENSSDNTMSEADRTYVGGDFCTTELGARN